MRFIDHKELDVILAQSGDEFRVRQALGRGEHYLMFRLFDICDRRRLIARSQRAVDLRCINADFVELVRLIFHERYQR